jgi:hypothetical protein
LVPSDDEVFKALVDHYKDSFAYQRAYLTQRDWFFAASIVALMVMLFQLAAPQSSERVIGAAIGKQLGLQEPVDIRFVTSAVWFLVLATILRYCQTVVLTNSQYNYLHALERKISQYYEGSAFTREGVAYLSDYPRFSNWADLLYRGMFPLIVVIVTTAKVWSDLAPGWGAGGAVDPYLVFNVVVYVFLLVSVLLYVEVVNLGRTVLRVVAGFRERFSQRKSASSSSGDGNSPAAAGSPVAGPDSTDRVVDQG